MKSLLADTTAALPRVVSLTTRWVAIYVRISRDKSGRAENVETQVEHCTTYADRQWPGVAVRVYCDNDITAADPNAHRPAYAELLVDIAAGKVAQVVSADQDRLTRQPAEWEALMPVLLDVGITETYGYRDGVTSVVPGQRAPGRFKSAMGAEYVEGLKVKIVEKLDKLARQGRPHGAATFGYRHGVGQDDEGKPMKVLLVDEDEAAILRWMAAEILDGRTCSAIADELNERGTRGTRGGVLNGSAVKSMVTNATVAGYRVHKGEIVTRGTWEPILDEATWRAMKATTTARAQKGERHKARKYVLSGHIFCVADHDPEATYGRKMNGQMKMSGKVRRPYYQCRCGMGILGEPVEELVAESVLAKLDELAVVRNAVAGIDIHQERRAEVVRELGTYQDRRAEAGRMFATGVMDGFGYAAAKLQLDEDEAALNAELAAMPSPDEALDPDAIRLAWAGNDVAEQREILALLIDKVTIRRGEAGRRRLDLSRVSIEGPGWG